MSRVHPLVALVCNLLMPQRQEQQAELLPELADLGCIEHLRRKEGSVTVILGRRESGKTVLAYRLAELLQRPVFAVSPEEHPPDWVTELSLEEIAEQPPPFSTLVLDDLPVYMSSRDYTNALVRVVEHVIPVVRHKRKLHLIFCSQLSALADKYVLDADLALLKPPSLLYRDLERPGVRRIQDRILAAWEGKSDYWIQRHAFVLAQTSAEFCRVLKARSE